ncbi:MAG: hypothetical protein KGS61_07465 [Verrucomicrobia bacterium]|nr:hypothetical protein [Verrucomicrobiota bacterium]
MQVFLDAVARELQRPRPLLKQVADHLCSHYALARDQLATYLATELDGLEDYEIDLVFSPMFTPTLEDQAAFSDLLDTATLPAAEWPALIERLAARPVVGSVRVEHGQEVPVRLRPVVIARFVNRLNLEVALPAPLAKLLNSLPPAEDRPLLKALARRPVWQAEGRRQVLFQFLVATAGGDGYRREDLVTLLKWMETYQPRDTAEVLARLPHWREVKRREIATAGTPKPFFSDRIQELHGGGRDQRSTPQASLAVWQAELAFLERLHRALTD